MTDDDLYKLVNIVHGMDEYLAVYIKWHCDPPQAKRVLHTFLKEELGFDADDIENLNEPKFERWRNIPDNTGELGSIIKIGSGRGSYPVTVIDLIDWAR